MRAGIWGDLPIGFSATMLGSIEAQGGAVVDSLHRGEHPIARRAAPKHPLAMQTRNFSFPGKMSARLETPAPTPNQVAEMVYQFLLSQRYPEGHRMDLSLEAEAQSLSGPRPNRRVL
jgi:hypothetical protein